MMAVAPTRLRWNSGIPAVHVSDVVSVVTSEMRMDSQLSSELINVS